ncbi:VOC family protein [Kitasatospora sp. NPDC085879]|uniref:VOC family protein n=1 Tax=Kitasatospora sp. NPDC085879 TaxID=3154769 RepID=UPI003412B00B
MTDVQSGFEKIRPRYFHESEGLQDWRVLGEGACAYFRTGSFAAGARFVQEIGDLAGLGADAPDVDLRPEGVTVRLITLTEDYYGLTGRHIELARQISAVARKLELPADPSAVQTVQVTVDALAGPAVVAFWRALLGYRERAGSAEDLVDPHRRGAPFYFQQMGEPRPQRNRVHVDVWVPYDLAEARIAAAIAAGGRLVNDEFAPSTGCWPTRRATRPASARPAGRGRSPAGTESCRRPRTWLPQEGGVRYGVPGCGGRRLFGRVSRVRRRR